MINWKKYIDKVYIINCPKQDKERTNGILSELKRIGIPDDLIYNYYNIQNKIVNIAISPELKINTHSYNVTLGHYYCMKQAEEFNYEKIMIIENDVVFLHDLEIIQNALDLINKNIYKYDIITNGNFYSTVLAIHDKDTNGEASVNFYSKQGYQKIINLFENKYMLYIDAYEQFIHEKIYTGYLEFPIGVQNKLLFIENYNETYKLYDFHMNRNNYENFFINYFFYNYNYFFNGIYMIGRDNNDYYKFTKNLINYYSYYNENNKYNEDIKYIDYIYEKYILHKEVDIVDFEKCIIFKNDSFRINDSQIIYI